MTLEYAAPAGVDPDEESFRGGAGGTTVKLVSASSLKIIVLKLDLEAECKRVASSVSLFDPGSSLGELTGVPVV